MSLFSSRTDFVKKIQTVKSKAMVMWIKVKKKNAIENCKSVRFSSKLSSVLDALYNEYVTYAICYIRGDRQQLVCKMNFYWSTMKGTIGYFCIFYDIQWVVDGKKYIFTTKSTYTNICLMQYDGL